jgi:hypothetical protein
MSVRNPAQIAAISSCLKKKLTDTKRFSFFQAKSVRKKDRSQVFYRFSEFVFPLYRCHSIQPSVKYQQTTKKKDTRMSLSSAATTVQPHPMGILTTGPAFGLVEESKERGQMPKVTNLVGINWILLNHRGLKTPRPDESLQDLLYSIVQPAGFFIINAFGDPLMSLTSREVPCVAGGTVQVRNIFLNVSPGDTIFARFARGEITDTTYQLGPGMTMRSTANIKDEPVQCTLVTSRDLDIHPELRKYQFANPAGVGARISRDALLLPLAKVVPGDGVRMHNHLKMAKKEDSIFKLQVHTTQVKNQDERMLTVVPLYPRVC